MELQVKDIMTKDPACCTPETTLQKVAQMMVEYDCGEVPVIQDRDSMIPVGVITDRDIICRTLSKGKNPLDMKVADCMTTPCFTVEPASSLKDCMKIMEEHQVRRVPVVDSKGRCVGIVSQADLARHAPKQQTGEVVKQVSQGAGR